MKAMTILVTGADGQLGRSLRREAAGSEHRYLFTDVDRLDITDAPAVERFLVENAVDVVVNCAAYTDVERAESDAARAELLNATAAGHLARAAKAVGATLIHVSTDYVFGGAPHNTPLKEDAAPAPTGVYGLTKLHGEQAVAASGCKAVVLRTAWLYSEYGKNFLRTMLRLTAERQRLDVVFDQAGTPTYAGDLAHAVVAIIENRSFEGREGVYHYSNEGVCSWYDFAVEIAALAGNGGCDVRPCLSSEFPSAVVRPSYSVLDKSKFKHAFSMKIPHWRVSLAKCMENIRNNEA